jgi:hypothetical protein
MIAKFTLAAALAAALSGCFGMKTGITQNDPGTGALAGADSDSGSDGESDGDSDTGTGTNGDADTGTDTEPDDGSEPGCGEIDVPCCAVEPFCAGGAIPIADGADGCVCALACTPAECTDDNDLWTAEFVACFDVNSGVVVGACLADEDLDPITTGCEDPTLPCTTPSGYAGGVCLSDGSNDYCLRQCAPDNDVCDVVHVCTALFDGSGFYVGGACVPRV